MGVSIKAGGCGFKEAKSAIICLSGGKNEKEVFTVGGRFVYDSGAGVKRLRFIT
jgi:hypothetical protein